MKKYFYLAAVSAMMLTACSSEKDVLETTTGPAKQEVTQQAVGFDVYTPAATAGTRAGLEGTMTTGHMQRSEQYGGGFGVYAYLTEDVKGSADATTYATTAPVAPNFMANEKLLWNTVNQGWYYNPLKYWPNETNNDSQSTPAYMESDSKSGTTPAYDDMHLDRLTFFAYAPYVEKADATKPGITYFTNKNGKLTTGTDVTGESYSGESVKEAGVGYKAALTNPDKAVDLLWGVAPAGGLTYTAVNGQTVNVKEGMPLIDMTKPNVNTTMKFLFNHALARIGVTAVAAIDQVGAGGTLDPNTKITIKEITLTGYFGETGLLNLDNDRANVANWYEINGKNLKASTAPAIGNLIKSTITISGDAIAQHLRYKAPTSGTAPVEQDNGVGVTTVRQNVIEPSSSGDKNNGTATDGGPWVTSKSYDDGELAYSETTPYYKDATCGTTNLAETLALGAVGTAASGNTRHYCTIDQNGVYTVATATGAAIKYKYPAVMTYYEVEFHKIANATDAATYATSTAYTLKDGVSGTTDKIDDGETLTPKADIPAAGDFVITESKLKVPYYDDGIYFKRDANYFMVVPTNNIEHVSSAVTASDDKALRTVRVKIEYYITTEDSKLANLRAQTKNVIEKDVVFPSLANGKSYNLNLILGLTSVKMEAEVDDWKVINVNADLPQNTAD